MTVERRWILTHDGPYDLTGMPAVQTCELVTAQPEPVPQPLGDIENVRVLAEKQAELEYQCQQAREQADHLRRFPWVTTSLLGVNLLVTLIVLAKQSNHNKRFVFFVPFQHRRRDRVNGDSDPFRRDVVPAIVAERIVVSHH